MGYARRNLDRDLVVPQFGTLAGPYWRVSAEVLTPEEWGDIIEMACRDACFGDDRARDWIQRLLGIADIARTEEALRLVSTRSTHFQLLGEVEAARNASFFGETPADALVPDQRAPAPAGRASYWTLALEIVTPMRWKGILEVARDQALGGDPRAREFLTRVLGADGALNAISAHGDDEGSTAC